MRIHGRITRIVRRMPRSLPAAEALETRPGFQQSAVDREVPLRKQAWCPRLAENAIVTHPGPMVRGVEIASDVADMPRTVVTQQVANGIAVRMAILFLLLGGELQGMAEVPAVA